MTTPAGTPVASVSVDHAAPPVAPSSVSVWRTSSGKARWSVRVGAGLGRAELEAAAALAVELDAELAARYADGGQDAS
jgi:hypothetical protein